MKPWIIGNWKLNPATYEETKHLIEGLTAQVASVAECHVVVAPSFVHLTSVAEAIKSSPIQLSSQDISALTSDTGAYTGDISAAQLKDIGVAWVIIGHSERRQYYYENNDVLFKKVQQALQQDLGVIFCIGESEAEFDAGETNTVLQAQLAVIAQLTNDKVLSKKLAKVIIAYEPVWAIGTGKVPSVEQVADVHIFIRTYLQSLSDNLVTTPILYGGSVKPENSDEFANCHYVDGVLVGGAALNANSFIKIAQSFCHK